MVAVSAAFGHWQNQAINSTGGYVVVHPSVSTAFFLFSAVSGTRHPYRARMVNADGTVANTAGPFSDNEIYTVVVSTTASRRCSIDNQAAAAGVGNYRCTE